MANITATLTLHSTNITSDELNLSVSDVLSIKSPSVGVSKTTITTTGANHIIVPANDNKQTWLFVRHTGTSDGSSSTSAHCDIEITGDVAVGTLKPNEWFFFPFCGNGASKGVQLQAVGSAVQCEYAYWSDSTAQ